MKTKYFLLFLCFSYCIINCEAQTPGWQWAKVAGSNQGDDIKSSCIDSQNNLYITGYYSGDEITFGDTTLWGNVLLTKFDSYGNFIWAKIAEGGNIRGEGICFDKNGNLYLVGSFFLSMNIDTITITAMGWANFLAKYDTLGNVIWLKKINEDGIVQNTDMCTDTSGNIYITGFFGSSSTSFDTIVLTNNGTYNIFTAKYDANGSLKWVKSIGGTSWDQANGISIDNEGNIYLTGQFRSPSIVFDNDTLINSIGDSSTSDIFIIKYDTEGNEIWAKSLGGTDYDKGYDIKNDRDNNVYVAGHFFGHSISFDNVTLLGDGCNNTLLLKYSSAGNLIWAKGNENSFNNKGVALSIDSINNIYVGGDFADILTVGDYQLVSTDDDGVNIYIVKYDSLGNVVNAISADGDSFDITTSMSIDNSGKVYITGRTEGSYISFGNYNLITQAESQSPDIFIAKLSECNFITPTINKLSNTLLQSSPAASYQWYFNGVIINGATSQTYSAIENGYYTVAVSDSSGCSASSKRMVVLGVGINEINNNLFFIYPNPATNFLTIEQPAVGSQQLAVKIYNIQGQLILQSAINNQKSTLDISAIANGIYVLLLYDKKAEPLKTEKVVKGN